MRVFVLATFLNSFFNFFIYIRYQAFLPFEWLKIATLWTGMIYSSRVFGTEVYSGHVDLKFIVHG